MEVVAPCSKCGEPVVIDVEIIEHKVPPYCQKCDPLLIEARRRFRRDQFRVIKGGKDA